MGSIGGVGPAGASGVCANCSKPLTGAFCAHCGTPAQPQEGWGAAASELFDPHEPRGHFATLFGFLRSPVDTIIRLTEDASYRRHWTFLSLALATQFALAFLILPRLLGAYYAVPDLGGKAAVITSQVVQYAGIIILTPIQYYLCRLLGKIPRTPWSYVKLCVLSVSFGAIIGTLLTLAFWGVGVASTAAGQPIDAQTNGLVMTLLAEIAVITFVTATHKRFWGMSWPVAIGVTLAIAALSWGVVYPLLTQAVIGAGIVPLIDELLP